MGKVFNKSQGVFVLWGVRSDSQLGVFAQISNKMHMECLPSCAFLLNANEKQNKITRKTMTNEECITVWQVLIASSW